MSKNAATEKIYYRLKNRDIKLREFEDYLDPISALKERNKTISKVTLINLDSLLNYSFDPAKTSRHNCENPIGGISIPVGIAGPVKIMGEYAKGLFFAPIATTEGALVASISRGMKLINLGGGVKTICALKGATRAPVFIAENIASRIKFELWIEKQKANFIRITNQSDPHITFLSSEIYAEGRYIWIRFSYDTDEAMGMNMATNATSNICDFVSKKQGYAKLISISGNMCSDKKPSFINKLLGRGRLVEAECTLDKDMIMDILNVDIKTLLDTYSAKLLHGSRFAGSLGCNLHSANTIAGIYLATGQDPAHVVDASICDTSIEQKDKNTIYCSIRIPSLMVGSIGGGTSLKNQNVCLNLATKPLGKKQGRKQSNILSELIAASVLAGELSLLGSLANNTLASAHSKYGQGKINN